ncbi:MAG: hypothetical protein DRI98_12130 [Bacteroidetes bacterium]|nr:MAG: hypothetical protein DRI98_12130 [Bacteroidota bacterium]
MYTKVLKHFAANHIFLTPGGRWELSPEQVKQAIDAKRTDNLKWDSYPEDNMGRHFITKEQNIIVVDIDGAEVIEHSDGIYLPSLDIKLPPTLMTTTTRTTKYHFYYKVPDSTVLGNRMVKVVDNIDLFTYGVVFDLHFYSPNHSCNYLDVVEAPQELIDKAKYFTDSKAISSQPQALALNSNIPRYNLIVAFLKGELTQTKALNAFFRSVFPHEYVRQGAKKLTFEEFTLNYDLINKIAVKLTTTKELGTHEHTIPALHKIIEALGGNPESAKTRQFLHKQMLPTLPEHQPEVPYTLTDDALTIQEHIDKQDTSTPVFKVLIEGRPKYIQIDRFTLEPIEHNGIFFLNEDAAQALNPERNIVNNEGRVVGWDSQLPIVYVTDSPYDRPVFVDDEHNRNVLNIYKRTRYLKEASPRATIPDNFIIQLMQSSIHPDYLELVMQYHAQVIFGDRPPVMVLWIASLKSDKGGTGKSIITIDLLSRILGTAGAVVSEDDMAGNWGDVLVGARCISLEDLPTLGTRQFDKLYASIKQATSSAQKRLNMKGVSFQSTRLKLSITGSSNERLALHPSDRRFLCLEPAHYRGHTEPLSPEVAMEVEDFRASDTYSIELQEYTDYLLYLYQSPMSLQMKTWLFISPPETPYRTKWIASAQTNSANVITLLNTPWALHDSVRVQDMNLDDIVGLYTLLIKSYNEKTQKVALPWNWFAEILPFIQSHKGNDPESPSYSKAQVAKMLSIDFVTNVGTLYSDKWERKWKQSGYIYKTTPEAIQDFRDIIGQLHEEEVI